MILFAAGLLLFLAPAISLTVIAPNKYFLIFTACIGIAFAVFCIVDAIIIARRKKGDKIETKESAVEVNGEVLNEEVVKTYPKHDDLITEPYYVPQDHYFVMGDNRDNSMDSRFFGAVPRDYFLGKALAVYWSFETPRDQFLHAGVSDRIRQSGDVLINFFSKTRWTRFGLVIE